MLNQCYRINGLNRKAPPDGATLMLECGKNDGLTMYEFRGFSKTAVLKMDPVSAEVRRFGHGDLNAWTNKHRGDWEVCVRGAEGERSSFHMKSKWDAFGLKKWVEQYMAKKGGN